MREFDCHNCFGYLRYSDVRTMHEETAPVIGNVSTHCAESSVASEGEAGQTTKVEVAAVNIDQLLLEVASQLIAAKRGAQKGVLGSVSLGREGGDGLGLQISVGDGTGESGFDHLIKAGRRSGGRGSGGGGLLLLGSLLLGGLSGRLRGLLHGLGGRWHLLVLSTDDTDGGDTGEDVLIVHCRRLTADGAGRQSALSLRGGKGRNGRGREDDSGGKVEASHGGGTKSKNMT